MLHRHQRLAFEGSVHFITTVTSLRGNWFIEPSRCLAILSIFEFCRNKFQLECFGYVLMPDHLHALLWQRSKDEAVPRMMESFKRLTARRCKPIAFDSSPLWRRHYDDVLVPGPDAARTKLKYIHENPVKRGLSDSAIEYSWSSASFYFRNSEDIIRLKAFE